MKKEKSLAELFKTAIARIGESNVNASAPKAPGLASPASKPLGSLSSEIGVAAHPIPMTQPLTGNSDLKASPKASLNYGNSPVNRAPTPVQVAGTNPGYNSAKLPSVKPSSPVASKGFSQFSKLAQEPEFNSSRVPAVNEKRTTPYTNAEITIAAQNKNYPVNSGAILDSPPNLNQRKTYSQSSEVVEPQNKAIPNVQKILKPMGRAANTAGAVYNVAQGDYSEAAKAIAKKEIPVVGWADRVKNVINQAMNKDFTGAALEGAGAVVPVVPDAIQFGRDVIRNIDEQAEDNKRLNMRSREVQGSVKECRNTGIVDVDGNVFVNDSDSLLLGKLGFSVEGYIELTKTSEVLDLYSYMEKVAGVPKAVARAVDKGEAFSGSLLEDMEYSVPKGYEVKGDLVCPIEKEAEEEGRVNNASWSPELLQELTKRIGKDQSFRSVDAPATQTPAEIQSSLNIDKDNLAWLKPNIAKFGLPQGPEGKQIGLLTQHADSDPDFQETVLQQMRTHNQNNPGVHDNQTLAHLDDRVNVNRGKPQLYGSQGGQVNENGQWVWKPRDIFEPHNLETRRKEMGLAPHKEYTDLLHKHFISKLPPPSPQATQVKPAASVPPMVQKTGMEAKESFNKTVKERVRVILPYEGKYILERLKNPKYPDNLDKRRHIGGGIEAGETPAQAAARELHEELGIKVDHGDFKHIGKFDNQHYLLLPEHNIKPGKYKASVGSDPFIHLEHGMPSGADYMGPDVHKLMKTDTEHKLEPLIERLQGLMGKKAGSGSEGQSDPDSRINKSLRKWNCKCGEAHDYLYEKMACVLKKADVTSTQPILSTGGDLFTRHSPINIPNETLTQKDNRPSFGSVIGEALNPGEFANVAADKMYNFVKPRLAGAIARKAARFVPAVNLGITTANIKQRMEMNPPDTRGAAIDGFGGVAANEPGIGTVVSLLAAGVNAGRDFNRALGKPGAPYMPQDNSAPIRTSIFPQQPSRVQPPAPLLAKSGAADYPLTSSVIKAIGYEPKERALDVSFHNGREYRHNDVPRIVFNRFKKVKSPGKYYNENLRKKKEIDPEDARVKSKFKYLFRKLKEKGVLAGTYHERIAIPKDKLTEDDIKRFGFEPSLIAIPESGQDQFSSYRHPKNLHHIHSHNDHWTIHKDEHPSLSMALRNSDLLSAPAAVVDGLSHIVTEGVPGAYKYVANRINGGAGMLEAVLRDSKLKKTAARRLPKVKLNQPLLPGLTEWIKHQPFNHAEELFRQGVISAKHRDDIVSGRLHELTKDKFKAMLDTIANTPPGM